VAEKKEAVSTSTSTSTSHSRVPSRRADLPIVAACGACKLVSIPAVHLTHLPLSCTGRAGMPYSQSPLLQYYCSATNDVHMS
jgi:hypothetical protein